MDKKVSHSGGCWTRVQMMGYRLALASAQGRRKSQSRLGTLVLTPLSRSTYSDSRCFRPFAGSQLRLVPLRHILIAYAMCFASMTL